MVFTLDLYRKLTVNNGAANQANRSAHLANQSAVIVGWRGGKTCERGKNERASERAKHARGRESDLSRALRARFSPRSLT